MRQHSVAVRDLYGEGFVPVLTAEERERYYDEAANRRGVEDHVASLQRAQALIFVYPTWWYGLPAMLKGWLERVWVPGIAFRLGPDVIRPMLGNIHRIAVVTTLWLAALVTRADRLAG